MVETQTDGRNGWNMPDLSAPTAITGTLRLCSLLIIARRRGSRIVAATWGEADG